MSETNPQALRAEAIEQRPRAAIHQHALHLRFEHRGLLQFAVVGQRGKELRQQDDVKSAVQGAGEIKGGGMRCGPATVVPAKILLIQ